MPDLISLALTHDIATERDRALAGLVLHAQEVAKHINDPRMVTVCRVLAAVQVDRAEGIA